MLVDLSGLLADAPPCATLVVFHSAVAAYLDQDQRRRFTDIMHALKTTLGVRWASNEAPGVIAGVDIAPRPQGRFMIALDQVPVAVAEPHGHTLHRLR